MRRAYHAPSAVAAEAELTALAAELDKTHPGAAASLREGLPETLTVLRLGVPPTLARTLRSTDAIESMISICREHSSQRHTLARRHHGAALVRRRHARGRQAVPPVNGHLHLETLRAALDRHVAAQKVGTDRHNHTVNAA
jgi:hypothetical protein